jgi:ribosomal-protein-serine acetyltransferase
MFPGQTINKIELRLIELSDVEELFRLIETNRQHLRAWLPWVDAHTSTAATAAFVSASIRKAEENHGFSAGIWFEGHLCGIVAHHRIDWTDRCTSLGYWLDAAHEGNGIMTRSCRAVIDHAFTALDLHRVVIRCAMENHRSCAIPERLGFTLEGIERQSQWLYDHFVDLSVYALLRSDGSSEPV